MFQVRDDNGGNTKEDDVLPCKAEGAAGDAGVQVRGDPEQCSQVYDLTSAGLTLTFVPL